MNLARALLIFTGVWTVLAGATAEKLMQEINRH